MWYLTFNCIDTLFEIHIVGPFGHFTCFYCLLGHWLIVPVGEFYLCLPVGAYIIFFVWIPTIAFGAFVCVACWGILLVYGHILFSFCMDSEDCLFLWTRTRGKWLFRNPIFSKLLPIEALLYIYWTKKETQGGIKSITYRYEA